MSQYVLSKQPYFYVIIEWQESADFLKSKLLTTLLFADDQVILTASEDSIQKSLHHLSVLASKYNLPIFTSKTKILAMKGKELIRTKIGLHNNIIEEVRNFSYQDCRFGSNRNLDYGINYKRLITCEEQLNVHCSIKANRKQY
jgi:hypothetical protein